MNWFRKDDAAICAKCGVYFRPTMKELPFADHCEQHRRPLLDDWTHRQAVAAWAAGSGFKQVDKLYEEARVTAEAKSKMRQDAYAQMTQGQAGMMGNIFGAAGR